MSSASIGSAESEMKSLGNRIAYSILKLGRVVFRSNWV